MSSRAMSLDVLVRLRDKLSGPLRALRGQLEKLVSLGRRLGLLGTAIAAISFMGPIKEAAAFQQKLLDIAGTAELSGKAAFKAVEQMRERYEGLALDTGQLSDTVAEGAGSLIAKGLDQKLIDASIGDIAKTATAANAEFADMADVAAASLQTLQLPSNQLKDAMGALVVSGKEGAFELKDMARYFPTLTGQVTKFGVKGREAVNFLGAALQIARKGTSDPGEAANNLKNFLSKILAPATIKNFKDAGVDIEAVMKDAATKGINPIEAVLEKITKLTGTSGKEIAGMLAKAKAQGLEGADAMALVREQLEKIHGAGKLGELFADQQVMDFLIPFMANVDEYKRIKAEVAKATGAIIDTDFETQMAGLNRQLMVFNEIGTQAAREVGFAFGSWLPSINENLQAGLKWYRQWNKETGGLGTKLLTLAGGGVLAAVALGAIGLAVPVLGAGLAALAALLSPVGLAIAAIAAAGVYLYKNWGTYGPRVMRLWDRTKRGFFSFIDGARDRIRRIVAAGREIYDRFAPQIARGFNAAWQDIKGGWENIKSFLQSVAKAADIKFDFSGLSIDGAKVALIEGLGVAMQGLAAAWGALKDFGSGFALHLPEIGEDVGRTIKSIGEIGSNLWRLAGAIAKLVGLDTGKLGGFFKTLGDWVGRGAAFGFQWIGNAAEFIANLTGALADLAEGKPVDWKNIFPDDLKQAWDDIGKAVSRVVQAISDFFAWVAKPIDWSQILSPEIITTWNNLKEAVDKVKGAWESLKGAIRSVIDVIGEIIAAVQQPIDWSNLLPDSVVGTWNRLAGAINAVKGALAGLGDLFKGSGTVPGEQELKAKVGDVIRLDDARRMKRGSTTESQPGKTVDDFVSGWRPKLNLPGQQSSMVLPKQEVQVGGAVVIKVDGPAQVASVSSTNKAVPLTTSNTGRVVGRV